MIAVGVTGRIGSGKTALCRILASRHGCGVIDADLLGHEALNVPPLRDRVARRFGGGVLSSEGEVDRTRLGNLVFSDPGALRDLEAIVHPWIIESIGSSLARLRSAGEAGIVLIDAALILLWKGRIHVDKIIWVRASEETRIMRLRARGMSRDEIARRLDRQPSDDEFRESADLICSNDGDLDDLAVEAERLWEALRAG